MATEIPNKVDELRSALINAGVDEAKVAKLNKVELRGMYSTVVLGEKEAPFGNVYEQATGDSNQVTSGKPPESKQDALPQYGSPEWQIIS